MELTRERKILLALAAVGGAALIADRLFSSRDGGVGGPAQAAARASDAASPASPASVRLGASTPNGSGAMGSNNSTAPLLHRMQELPEAKAYERVAGLDAFKPPASWLPEPPPVVEEEEEPAVDTRAERFERMHRLTAIMSGPSGELAVIGGHTVRVGQELDGFKLVALETRSAVFRSADGLEVTLSLPEPRGSQPRRR